MLLPVSSHFVVMIWFVSPVAGAANDPVGVDKLPPTVSRQFSTSDDFCICICVEQRSDSYFAKFDVTEGDVDIVQVTAACDLTLLVVIYLISTLQYLAEIICQQQMAEYQGTVQWYSMRYAIG